MTHSARVAGLPPFTPESRTSGVLLHVTSLPSPYGIGDVGPAASREAETPGPCPGAGAEEEAGGAAADGGGRDRA